MKDFLLAMLLLLAYLSFGLAEQVHSHGHGHADSLIEEGSSLPPNTTQGFPRNPSDRGKKGRKSMFDNPRPDNPNFTYSKPPSVVVAHASAYDVIKPFWMEDDDGKMVLVFWMSHRSMANQVAMIVYSDAIFKGRHYLSVKRFMVLDPDTNKIKQLFPKPKK
tara:strand:- start:5414 stop:5899 length:486 start_codon:yes stop_codon:yes gene_type:complete